MSKRILLAGKRFHKLVVLEDTILPNGRSGSLCICDCGNTKLVWSSALRHGHTGSCGCYARAKSTTHGLARCKAYRSWANMLTRCNNPKDTNYALYGGRGIKVCEEWKKFENFFADMGHRPDGLSLERIDSNKGYFRENCKWATAQEQTENRRCALVFTIRGVTACLKTLCAAFGVEYDVVRCRIRRAGWNPEEAMFTPRKSAKVKRGNLSAGVVHPNTFIKSSNGE